VNDALEKMSAIIRELFDEYDGRVTRELSAGDVPQWDSLANVRFVLLVEKTFGVRFSAREVGNLKNIGGLLDIIAKRALKL
jgi:acyl carrier protein